MRQIFIRRRLPCLMHRYLKVDWEEFWWTIYSFILVDLFHIFPSTVTHTSAPNVIVKFLTEYMLDRLTFARFRGDYHSQALEYIVTGLCNQVSYAYPDLSLCKQISLILNTHALGKYHFSLVAADFLNNTISLCTYTPAFHAWLRNIG